MTEILTGILRAVRQPAASKMATGFELGKLLSQNELERSASVDETVDETDVRRAVCARRSDQRLEEETSPQLHNSAARHRLREFDRKSLDPCLTTIVVKATISPHARHPSHR
jgi:hypothetical protein